MPEIVIPAADGAPEPEAVAPDDFGADLLAQFEKRTTTTAAPADEMGMSPYPGGVKVDAGDQFAAMAAELNAAKVAEINAAAADSADVAEEPVAEDAPAAELPAPDPATAVDEPAGADVGGYVWNYLATNGQPAAVRYDDRQVQEAISLKAWADGLGEELRYTLGAVESGQAVAIARNEYDQFQAWKGQQDRSQRDTDLARLDVEPDVAKVISDLRDEVASLRTQSPDVGQPQPNYNPNVTQALHQAVSHYQTARQLSQEEVNRLVANAQQSNIISHFQREGQRLNPVTGQLLADADPATVIYKSLDYALYQDPALHAAVVARTTQPQPVLTGQPDQATAPTATVTDITAKRARAASLASAPSAAVTPAPRTIHQMSDQQRIEGMAEEIARAQSGTG